jgi:hypothetical protein
MVRSPDVEKDPVIDICFILSMTGPSKELLPEIESEPAPKIASSVKTVVPLPASDPE